MGYRIVYGKKKGRFRQPKKGKKALIVAVVSMLLFAVGFWGRTELLPGNRQNSGAALENLIEAVQEGVSISDAVVAFCREIIANAQTPY